MNEVIRIEKVVLPQERPVPGIPAYPSAILWADKNATVLKEVGSMTASTGPFMNEPSLVIDQVSVLSEDGRAAKIFDEWAPRRVPILFCRLTLFSGIS